MSNQNSQDARGSDTEPRFLVIGQIRKPHGVRGELKVSVHADSAERFTLLETVYTHRHPDSKSPNEVAVESVRFAGKDVLMKFAGYDDRDTAGKLRQHWVYVSAEDAVPLEEGEYFLYQLEGMDVITDADEPLGKITQVLETGANNVFVVKGTKGELLLPDIDDVILSIDLDAHRMVVHLLPGMGD